MSYSLLEAQVFGVSANVKTAIDNRHYYEDNLDELFKLLSKDDRPKVPGGLCSAIIDKSIDFLFPEGTKVQSGNDAMQSLLIKILDDTRLIEKLGSIGLEGHIGGTVGLKSIWLKNDKRWTLDIHPVEALEVEHNALDPEEILTIRIRFQYEAKNAKGETELWWHQERWTAIEYTEWYPQRVTPGKLPDFTDKEINLEASGPHEYGEIPITLITHKLQVDSPYGLPEITDTLKRYCRAYTISLSKVEVAAQLVATPAYKRINDKNKDPISIKPGTVIDIDGDGDLESDIAALEHPEIQESVFKFQQAVKALAYEHCRVTNPDVEAEMRSGGTISSVAWKAFNQHFISKILRLRVRYGEHGVEAHLKKIFRMGKSYHIPGYDGLDLENPEKDEIEIVYPPFFEPTVDEKVAEIGLYKMASLPAEELGRKIAMVLGIEREEVVLQIISEIEHERDLLEPTIVTGG